MKVYNKVVLDMETLEIVEEDSYEYEGPVALCGGGSGGGGSGEVDYPTYLKEAHAQMMYGSGESGYSAMSVTTPMDDAVNSAVSGNPYVDLAPYDPSTNTTKMASAVDDLETFIDNIGTTSKVESELAAFDSGMRDINAVNSSAFAIGRQLVASTLIMQKLLAKQELARLSIEARRIMIVANKEFIDADNEFEVKNVKWSLEMLQKGGNVLASIQGASPVSSGDEPNQTRSAVGGALSGAAAGAMYGAMEGTSVGGYMGAAVGGVLGAASSFL